ncbi:MAG: hypothetical protein GJ680_18405 [Alteromonadaceae bacterium]|nr:hypothetical protein [Alteromonadaceae bacterium]
MKIPELVKVVDRRSKVLAEYLQVRDLPQVSFDLEKSQVFAVNPLTKRNVVIQSHIIAIHDPIAQTLTWSWAETRLPETLRVNGGIIKEHGERYGFPDMTKPILNVNPKKTDIERIAYLQNLTLPPEKDTNGNVISVPKLMLEELIAMGAWALQSMTVFKIKVNDKYLIAGSYYEFDEGLEKARSETD